MSRLFVGVILPRLTALPRAYDFQAAAESDVPVSLSGTIYKEILDLILQRCTYHYSLWLKHMT